MTRRANIDSHEVSLIKAEILHRKMFGQKPIITRDHLTRLKKAGYSDNTIRTWYIKKFNEFNHLKG